MSSPCARPRRRAASILCLLAATVAPALSCSSSELTWLGVTVDNDPKSPVHIDTVQLSVSTLDGTLLQKATADLAGKPLPRTLALVRDDASLKTVRMTTTGLLEGRVVVEHKSDASFQAGEILYVPIQLSASCEKIWSTCAADQTCEAGRCQNIVTHHSGKAGSNTPSVAGSDGALDPGKAPAGTPRCVIKLPERNDELFFGDDIKLEGTCVDAERRPIEEGLQWSSNLDGVLATRATQMIKSAELTAGEHTFTLCAGEEPNRVCSEAVPVTLSRKPAPPTATIMRVSQEGAEDGGPFSSGEPITFVGSGSAAGGKFRLNWTDNFIGEFNEGGMASIRAPRVGRHRVTLMVTDRAGQTQDPPETIVFDVIDAERFEAGQRELVPQFSRVNATLREAGASAILALASDTSGMVLASTGDQIYAFRGDRLDGEAEPAIGGDGPAPMLSGVRAIVIDAPERDGHVYFGTTEGVTACSYTPGELPIEAERCGRYRGDGDNDLAGEPVTALALLEEADRRWLAVGTERGLWVASDDDGSVAGEAVRVTDDGEAIRGVVASGGSFWFATRTSGVYKYDPAAPGIAELYSTDAPAPPMSSLCSDEEGGIWLGTEEHGLSRFEPSGQWRGPWLRGDPFEGLASNRIKATAPAKGISMGLQVTMLWVGTDSGLSRLDFRAPNFTTLDTDVGLPSDDIHSLAVLPGSGHVVIGTSDGVALYNGS